MIKTSLWKVKEGKREEWLNWCKEIMAQYDEAAETLREEQLIREQCALFDVGDESYLVYLHQPEEEKEKLPANLEKPINQKHFKKMGECLERCTNRTEGYDVSV